MGCSNQSSKTGVGKKLPAIQPGGHRSCARTTGHAFSPQNPNREAEDQEARKPRQVRKKAQKRLDELELGGDSATYKTCLRKDT